MSTNQLPALAAASALTGPLLGVDVVAAGSAMLGTLFAGAWAEPIESRLQLGLVVVGSTVLACFAVAILPAFGFEWAKTAPPGPLCGVMAAALRLFLGATVKRGRHLIAVFNPMDWLPSRRSSAAAGNAMPAVAADDTKPPAPPET